jgi:Tol biopolymer transport system component
LPLFGERKAFPLLRTDFNETSADLSPDGGWIAYASDESGRFEVYISSFPSLEHKVKVSTDGGNLPLWSHDGKELFYIAPVKKLMSVGVKAGTSFEPGLPKELFETSISGGPGGRRYDVANDGKRFLIVTQVEANKPLPISVVLNWTAGLKK